MKNLRKFLSGFIAAVTIMSSISITASAYDNCDVDRDGYVSVADVAALSKYLNGIYSVTNYNQLDVNRSLTVDEADYKCLVSRILGTTYNGAYFSRKTGNVVSPPTVSGFTPSNSSSDTTGRTYRRCRYDNNGQPTSLSDYTLIPEFMGFNNAGAGSRAVIGEDDRYASYSPENNGIVYFETNNGRNQSVATGFIVGDHQIATAAHCVYEDGWYTLSKVNTYDSNGCIISDTIHPVEAHIPKSYDPLGDHMYDYALITVSDDLSDYVHFSLGTAYNVSASNYSNIPVYVTGCPTHVYDSDSGKNLPNRSKRLYSTEGRVMDKNNYLSSKYTDIICYDVDTSGGNSGGPVYTITKMDNKYVYTAIAIHHGGLESNGRNWGSMVTNYHLQFYNNNPNASY